MPYCRGIEKGEGGFLYRSLHGTEGCGTDAAGFGRADGADSLRDGMDAVMNIEQEKMHGGNYTLLFYESPAFRVKTDCAGLFAYPVINQNRNWS